MATNQNDPQIIWLTISSTFTFMSLIGITLAEASAARKEFAPYIIVKNLIILGIGLIMWWVLGYGFAFQDTTSNFIGQEKFGGDGWQGTDVYIEAALYGMVGLSTVLSVSASIAERVQPNALFAYTILTMFFSWPVAVAWGWGDGWLNTKFSTPFIDTGGACTIHIFAGASALVAKTIYGNRKGKYDENEQVPRFEPSSPISLYLGAMFLVLAMIAFHPASAPSTQRIGYAIFNTLLGGSTGCLIAWVAAFFLSNSILFHLYAILGGFLSGCITVSSIVQNVDAWEAFVVGFIGGAVFILVFFFGKRLHFDDTASIVPIQLFSGILGTIAVGFFDKTQGVFYDSDGKTLGIQVLATVVIAAWAAFWSAVVFGVSRILLRFRISDELQAEGLETAEFGWFGFQKTQYGTGVVQTMPITEGERVFEPKSSKAEDY